MKPHHTKNDSLGNLTKAVNFERQQRKMHQNRQRKIKKFDNLKSIEKQRLFNKLKGRKRHICFIKEYDKIQIVDNYIN